MLWYGMLGYLVVMWIIWYKTILRPFFLMEIPSIPKNHISLWSSHTFLVIEFVLMGMNSQPGFSFLVIGFYCLHPSLHCLCLFWLLVSFFAVVAVVLEGFLWPHSVLTEHNEVSEFSSLKTFVMYGNDKGCYFQFCYCHFSDGYEGIMAVCE